MSPRPTSKELAKHYAESYWQNQNVEAGIQKQGSIALSIKRYIELKALPLLRRDIPSVLEVGSSFGVTLSVLGSAIRDLGGRPELFALEPSSYAICHGADYYRGITVLGANLDDLDGSQLCFDLIVLSHVLEHFQNPVEALRTIASRMSPDSLLYVEVPNFFGHWSVDYAHNYCFTPISLRNTLHAAKLRLVAIDSLHRQPRWPMYLTCLACKTDSGKAEIRAESMGDIFWRRRTSQIAYRIRNASRAADE